MAYHFVKLTMTKGKPVYINGDNIAGFYQPNNQNTIVQMAGDDDSYFEVLESVETIAEALFKRMAD